MADIFLSILSVLLCGWLVFEGLYCFYLAFLAAWGLCAGTSISSDERHPFFAIVIPAHNEEKNLLRLLHSLDRTGYLRNRLSVVVVADHCGDATATVAEEMGAAVLLREHGMPGKAFALAEAMEHVRKRCPEASAVAVFDADNLVDPGFFTEMAGYLAAGYRVIQANVGIANPDDSVFTRLNTMNYAVTNRFKELARSRMGLTCRLRGHGMVFSTEVLDRLSWRKESKVEDQEMLLEIVSLHMRVVWAHGARVQSVIPAGMDAAVIQRKRWAGAVKSGITARALRTLFPRVFSGDMAALDLLVDFFMPSYSMLIAGAMTGLLLSMATGVDVPFLVPGYGIVLVFFALYYLLAAYLERLPPAYALSVLAAPVFILWRAGIFFRSLLWRGEWR